MFVIGAAITTMGELYAVGPRFGNAVQTMRSEIGEWFNVMLDFPGLTQEEYGSILKVARDYDQACKEALKTGVLASQEFEKIMHDIEKLPVVIVKAGNRELWVVRKE